MNTWLITDLIICLFTWPATSLGTWWEGVEPGKGSLDYYRGSIPPHSASTCIDQNLLTWNMAKRTCHLSMLSIVLNAISTIDIEALRVLECIAMETVVEFNMFSIIKSTGVLFFIQRAALYKMFHRGPGVYTNLPFIVFTRYCNNSCCDENKYVFDFDYIMMTFKKLLILKSHGNKVLCIFFHDTWKRSRTSQHKDLTNYCTDLYLCDC